MIYIECKSNRRFSYSSVGSIQIPASLNVLRVCVPGEHYDHENHSIIMMYDDVFKLPFSSSQASQGPLSLLDFSFAKFKVRTEQQK